jgi:xanthine/CO dehydrogenase XdhC/CoxF family maturation factor
MSPYLAALPGVIAYNPDAGTLTFRRQPGFLTLYPDMVYITQVRDAAEGLELLAALKDAINATWANCQSLAAVTAARRAPRPPDVYALLPQTNCRRCGEATCMAFVQPHFPPPKLIIVGGGHIGKPLQVMGEAAGFDVSVVDVETGRATAPELDTAGFTGDTYIVLITTDYVSDEAALRQALATPARYIGMIGSRAKCQTLLDHVRAEGYSETILAEIITVRRGGHGAPAPPSPRG